MGEYSCNNKGLRKKKTKEVNDLLIHLKQTFNISHSLNKKKSFKDERMQLYYYIKINSLVH